MAAHFRLPAVAKLLNENFVCILLDREERPDVDEVYQTFVAAVSQDGRSGWPMTVFLTPELTPFVGTTYINADRLLQALQSIAARWKDTRDSVVADGAKVMTALRDLNRARRERTGDETLDWDALTRAYTAAAAAFDVDNGGFGAPPKFPRASLFEFLTGMGLLHGSQSETGREALRMMELTLVRMSEGAIHDHLGGGFFRYSLDAAWKVPRFEKILADQAQLALSYLHGYLFSGGAKGAATAMRFRWVTERTLDFCLDHMRASDTGAFASAMDSDSLSPFDMESNGVPREGVFYLWSEWELKLILGEPAARCFVMRYGIEADGNILLNDAKRDSEFAGLSIPRVTMSLDAVASATGMSVEEVERSLESSCDKLIGERKRRPKPNVDDLVIACWNGFLISALARAGRILDEPRYLYAAYRAMDHILTHMVRHDESTGTLILKRTFRSGYGAGRVEGFAQDYCAVIQACLDCYEVSPPSTGAKYLIAATRLQHTLDTGFWDEAGGYAATAEGDSSILLRQREDYDGAEPSPSSLAALNCVRLASLTGDAATSARAHATVAAFAAVVGKSPLAMPMLLVSVQAFVRGKAQKVVICGADGDAAPFLREFWARALPRSIALLRLPEDGACDALAPLLAADRRALRAQGGPASAFVCTGLGCLRPTTNPQEFANQLDYLESVQAPERAAVRQKQPQASATR